MAESLKTRMLRWWFNLFPAYRGMGARITYIRDDLREVHVRLPLNRRTRNYRGTVFGGSMYGAVDPVYMIMLIKLLGPRYSVWDKSARIRFRRPARDTLYARFFVPDEETDVIRAELEATGKLERVYRVTLEDREGVVHAEVEKTIHVSVRDRDPGTGDRR